jgi:hypothetical protein
MINVENGFKLVDIATLDDAFHFVKTVQVKLQAVAVDEAAKFLGKRACNVYDAVAAAEVTLGVSALAFAYKDITEDITKHAEKGSFSPCELGCGLSLAISSQGVIGGISCPNKAILSAFFDDPAISPYSYVDDSSPPDGVTARDWSKRRGAWYEVLSSGNIARDMFSITCVDEHYLPLPDKELVSANMLGFEERLQSVSEQYTMTRVREELNIEHPVELANYMMNSSDYTERLAEARERLALILKQTLTIENLQEKI